MRLSRLTMREVFLSNDPYDASQSTVAVEFTPISDAKWTKFDNIQLRYVCSYLHIYPFEEIFQCHEVKNYTQVAR